MSREIRTRLAIYRWRRVTFMSMTWQLQIYSRALKAAWTVVNFLRHGFLCRNLIFATDHRFGLMWYRGTRCSGNRPGCVSRVYWTIRLHFVPQDIACCVSIMNPSIDRLVLCTRIIHFRVFLRCWKSICVPLRRSIDLTLWIFYQPTCLVKAVDKSSINGILHETERGHCSILSLSAAYVNTEGLLIWNECLYLWELYLLQRRLLCVLIHY